MYRALITISIDVNSDDIESARIEARAVAQALTMLPSACMVPESVMPIIVLDEDGTQLYPTPPCTRCGDTTTEERYETDGLCNYCNHIISKEMRDDK